MHLVGGRAGNETCPAEASSPGRGGAGGLHARATRATTLPRARAPRSARASLLRDLVGGAPEPRRDLLTWAPVAPRPTSGIPSQTISLRPFSGSARTTLRAGLAWIVIGSPVNGFVPGRALVAGLRTTLSFRSPGTTN